MGEFHHHPDGYVYVRIGTDTNANYGDTLANFASDYGQPAPTLPAGADEQIYTQGIRHCYNKNGQLFDGGPRTWAWGDNVIAAINTIKANQATRKANEPPLPAPGSTPPG